MRGRFQLKPPCGKSRIRTTNGKVSDHINSPSQMLWVSVLNFIFIDDQFQINNNRIPLCFGISKLGLNCLTGIYHRQGHRGSSVSVVVRLVYRLYVWGFAWFFSRFPGDVWTIPSNNINRIFPHFFPQLAFKISPHLISYNPTTCGSNL
jgi:hypothetical protein